MLIYGYMINYIHVDIPRLCGRPEEHGQFLDGDGRLQLPRRGRIVRRRVQTSRRCVCSTGCHSYILIYVLLWLLWGDVINQHTYVYKKILELRKLNVNTIIDFGVGLLGDDAAGVRWVDAESTLQLHANHVDFVKRTAHLHDAHWWTGQSLHFYRAYPIIPQLRRLL